ncbi:MAG: hypothetical protein Q9191_005454 [Dirinaria sp. TL-2023a]
MSTTTLPSNIHASTHPCLRAKLSQIRSKTTNARETKALVHEIALIIGCEALASSLQTTSSGTDETPIGYTYAVERISPRIALVPILRSGLAMVEALQTILPSSVPVHHLGLFREPVSLQPVEYYNNLPYHRPNQLSSVPELAILVDPLIATGGTSVAAIQTLFEWGVKKVLLIAVLGSRPGLLRAAAERGDGEQVVEIWVGGIDEEVNDRGMIKPGIGDVGDRLFLTIGK